MYLLVYVLRSWLQPKSHCVWFWACTELIQACHLNRNYQFRASLIFTGGKGKSKIVWLAMTRPAQNWDQSHSWASVIVWPLYEEGKMTGQEWLFQIAFISTDSSWCLSVPLSYILIVTLRKMYNDVLPGHGFCFRLVISQMLRSSLRVLPVPDFGAKWSL